MSISQDAVTNAILGLIVTSLTGLAAWAFNLILVELRIIRTRTKKLTDAVFTLAARLHPDRADVIIRTMQDLNKANGSSSILDDVS